MGVVVLRYLGYEAATQSIDANVDRICRLDDATPDRIRSMIGANLRDLRRILAFNVEHDIRFYRISSRVIPYASHPGHPVPWWDEFSVGLDSIAQFLKANALRVVMHPGHRTLLNAPSPETVALSILELGWHIRFLDAIQADASNKLVVRVGGKFGDDGSSVDRFVSVVNGFPDRWKTRLAVENDARYGVEEVLVVADRTGLPVAFDAFYHKDGGDLAGLLARCFATWKTSDGPPFVHVGGPSRDDGCERPHADWVDPLDVELLDRESPAGTPYDCLLGASEGERALFALRDRMTIREVTTPSPAYLAQ